MHGDQPSAKPAPTSAALAKLRRFTANEKRVSRYSARIGVIPVMCSPSARMNTPAIWLIPISKPNSASRHVRTTRPTATAPIPSATNTSVKPVTKPRHARITRRRSTCSESPSRSSSSERPETSER